ncbi:hypothetical protein C0Z16_18365 [Paraburkholderia rhynchosiae]|uniref:Uncharacterized protein n=1 Tax=Paraburkholderia rhynchosiae TaxID=487049 RepID=A0ABX4V5X3_9BURK|nr:hypothetical protein C0Z16_18365 [Paraburkholderia rhynchosiae]
MRASRKRGLQASQKKSMQETRKDAVAASLVRWTARAAWRSWVPASVAAEQGAGSRFFIDVQFWRVTVRALPTARFTIVRLLQLGT